MFLTVRFAVSRMNSLHLSNVVYSSWKGLLNYQVHSLYKGHLPIMMKHYRAKPSVLAANAVHVYSAKVISHVSALLEIMRVY